MSTSSTWTPTRIGRVSTVNARIGWKALTASEYQPDGYVFLATPNIKPEMIDFENVNYISEYRYEESPELKLKPGDVLLAKDGNTLGITNIVRELPRPATVNGSIAVLRPFGVEPRFLRYALASSSIQDMIDAIKGGMGVPHLFQWDIKRLPLNLPPLADQRRIADFLDVETARIDGLVRAISESSNLLEAKRRALLMSAFPDHGCTAARLGYYLDLVTSGPRGWGDYVGTQGTPFFRSANLRRDEIEPNLEDLALVDPPQSTSAEAARSRVRIGDVLIGITGANTGWVSLADQRIAQANVSQHVCLVRPGNMIDGRWLAYALSAPQVQELLLGSQYGGTKTQLSLGDIRNLVVSLPSLDEQRGIVAAITDGIKAIIAERALRDRQMTLLSERRQTLITATFTGGIAV